MIKNIIFDFGNVLFDIDLPRIGQSLQACLGERFEAAQRQVRDERLFERYETGELTSTGFIEAICRAGAPGLTAEQAVAAWNSIFLSMPRERFRLLEQLRRRYRVYLLSNINELHEHWIAGYLAREHGIMDFETRYFERVYYSHRIGLRKPDPACFQFVLTDAGLLPEETLFVDDLEENVAAARRLGIRGQVHPPDSDIVERMRPYCTGD